MNCMTKMHGIREANSLESESLATENHVAAQN